MLYLGQGAASRALAMVLFSAALSLGGCNRAVDVTSKPGEAADQEVVETPLLNLWNSYRPPWRRPGRGGFMNIPGPTPVYRKTCTRLARRQIVRIKGASDLRPRKDSNLRTRFRKPMLYPLSYGGMAHPGLSWAHA